MTQGEIPIRGDPDRICDLCSVVGSSPTSRETIAEGYDESQKTINQDIRYAIALGLMTETEDGVKATDRGINLSQTLPNEERRASYFRQAIADHEGYSILVDKLLRVPDGEEVQRRDVDKHLRVGLAVDLADDSRTRAATLFLRTIEAAGVGSYKQRRNNPSGLKITDEEARTELLSFIDGDNHPNEQDNPNEPVESNPSDDQSRESTGGLMPETQGTRNEQSITTRQTSDEQATGWIVNFDIQLQLDGTEDPENIKFLISAVRSGILNESELDFSPHSGESTDFGPVGTTSEADTDDQIEGESEEKTEETSAEIPSKDDTNVSDAVGSPGSEDNSGEDTSGSSPDSSLVDFN